uniref:Calponin-homology (CH) domain-containing protein n=1 Tax=Varanus komodoensis TaxID=61221 RepID=A0A8D2JJ07_VARKO
MPRLCMEKAKDIVPELKSSQQVTGRSFGDTDFRSALENGVLLCELLNSIKPGLIKKINRLPTPIAGLVSNSHCFNCLAHVPVLWWHF